MALVMGPFLGRTTSNCEDELVQYHGLSAFKKHNSPKFCGASDPEGAKLQFFEVEKIFKAMGSYEEHKVTYVTYMLS